MQEVGQGIGTGFLKRLEARISLALSNAKAGLSAFLAASNNLSQKNAALLGPGNAIAWTSSPFTLKTSSGKVLIVALQSGSTQAAGDGVLQQLLVDSTPIGAALQGEGSAVGKKYGGTLSWIATGLAAGPHTFQIETTNTNGANTVDSNVGLSSIVLVELPK